ncbi:C40 family peptidase [Nocardiopsis kunsanensis]|uniref:Transglycosylase n=1 Tax=Nocardiopsis kunsanensis TaxID=141693 RepID=A0A918XH21_9ACTN|nr:bifunctional lytic transglycosylase/C40 family peptidase [Nocardiopsis kunsanensis]GHD31290.1 transglycosylase [Nocardiopsis kunsanensis]
MEGSSGAKLLACGCLVAPVFAMFSLLVFILMLVTVDTDAEWETTGGSLDTEAVPEEFVLWIEQAADGCEHEQLSAPVLAAQLYQESRFDPDAVGPPVTVSEREGVHRAEGIAQFMPYTWETWAVDADDNGEASPFDAPDAIMAQGAFMCSLMGQAADSGYDENPVSLALAGYNAGWGAVEEYGGIPPYEETENYIDIILGKSEEFTDDSGEGLADPGVEIDADGDVAGAIQWAVAQVGTPYVYGGACMDPKQDTQGSPTGGWTSEDMRTQCDCSSLMQQAYDKIGVGLPRTTFDQINVGRGVSPGDVQPGDLVFPHEGHVGMYIGDGKVVHAPQTGKDVEITEYTEGYWGAYGVRRVLNDG